MPADPETWPVILAESITLIREKLTDNPDTVEVSALLDEMMQRRDFAGYFAVQSDRRQRGLGIEYSSAAGEVVYILGSALRMMIGVGEIAELGGGSHHYVVTEMFEELGWETRGDYRLPGSVGATPIRAAMAQIPPVGDIRWNQGSELIGQASWALRHRRPVLALVGARIAIEEAVRSALEDLGMERSDQPYRIVERERILFEDMLTSPRGFTPMDKSSTRAAFSAIRNAGDSAAHTGQAADAILAELHITTAPRAVASLSAAIDLHTT